MESAQPKHEKSENNLQTLLRVSELESRYYLLNVKFAANLLFFVHRVLVVSCVSICVCVVYVVITTA